MREGVIAKRQLTEDEKSHYYQLQMDIERQEHPDPHFQVAIKVQDWTDDEGNPLITVLTKKEVVWTDDAESVWTDNGATA